MINPNPVGRPRKEVTAEQLIFLYGKYGDWNSVAKHIGISRATLYVRLREYKLIKRYFFEDVS